MVTSLVNYNIRLKGLEHCVNVANAKAVIYGTEMTSAIQEVVNSGGFQNLELFSVEDRKPCEKPLSGKPHINLTKELKATSSKPTICNVPLNNSDIILLVYTSGTTGILK